MQNACGLGNPFKTLYFYDTKPADMKRILLPVFILALSSLHAQSKVTIVKYEKLPYIDPRPPHMKGFVNILVLSNADTLFTGNSLTLGKGTLPNGDFDFIATPSNTPAAKLKRTTSLKEVRVIEINRRGNEKYGYKYYVKVEGGYLIQLENAIATGEIVLDNSATVNK